MCQGEGVHTSSAGTPSCLRCMLGTRLTSARLPQALAEQVAKECWCEVEAHLLVIYCQTVGNAAQDVMMSRNSRGSCSLQHGKQSVRQGTLSHAKPSRLLTPCGRELGSLSDPG